MGKAIKEAKVKVGGQAGPMGKGQGVPLTQAVGQGGLKGAMEGKPMMGANSQVPGMKGLAERVEAAGKGLGSGVGAPKGMFGKTLFGNKEKFNQLYKRKMQQLQNVNPGSMAPPGQPMGGGVTKLGPPTHGGLVSKTAKY